MISLAPALTVVGSINLDLVARAASLPRPGETIGGATFQRFPGGKGANQALAARRLGAGVSLVARVGSDPFADEALALLRSDGVDLSGLITDKTAPTGVALIAVSEEGENQIIVAPGANANLRVDDLDLHFNTPLLCQLEVPVPVVSEAVRRARGFVALNLAPSLPVPSETLARADLIIVNEGEAIEQGDALNGLPALIAITLGAAGARLLRGGQMIAAVPAPAVTVVDTTGAGDTFCAALTLALAGGTPPEEAVTFACAAGALACTREGAQSSLPGRDAINALLAV
jgi:ribokinase